MAQPHSAAPVGPAMESRTIRYEFSENLPALLQQLNCTLLLSTYSTGNLVAVSAPQGQLAVSFHTFERPMGIAVGPSWLVIGGRTQVWSLRNLPAIAGMLEPRGRYDACYLTHFSYFTGNIQGHEMAWVSTPPIPNDGGTRTTGGVELWIVNTLFSCLCAATASYNFAPRWRPAFVSALAPEDRCHLNGLAVAHGQARYVTAMAETNSAQGWRSVKVGGGCVIDVASKEIVCRGLTMPHSPRIVDGRLLLLHSGLGQLVEVEKDAGRLQRIAELPGYTRGLAVHGPLAFVGLSKVRESSSSGGVPIAERPERLKCGFAVVDLPSGKVIAHFEFVAGIDELFDVQILPGFSSPYIAGPFADRGKVQPPWAVAPMP